MPTSEQISAIAETFAERYRLDLVSIKADAASLQRLLQSGKSFDPSRMSEEAAQVAAAGLSNHLTELEAIGSSDVPEDSGLVWSLVEQNLDEALRYAEVCAQLRRQYIETAKLYQDARFKFEEFVRLDLVHQDEVASGLYELPWREAQDEVAGSGAATEAAKAQQKLIDEMMSSDGFAGKHSALLTDAVVGEFVESSAIIARNTATIEKEKVYSETLLSTGYRSKLESATWEQSRLSVAGNVAQQEAKLRTSNRKEQYLRKDVGFRTHRAAISRQLAWLQIEEHCRKNSPLNYEERLSSLHALFNANLINLVERVQMVGLGLRSCYEIEIRPLSAARGTLLDTAATWLVDAQDLLAKFKRRQRVHVYSVSSKLMPSETKGEHAARIDIGDHVVGRLRGVSFELLGSCKEPVGLRLLPPATALPGRPEQILLFGRVCQFEPGLEIRPTHVDPFWNGLAPGSWSVALQAEPETLASVSGVVMHLWLATA